jgi:hypothetical protein
MQVKLCLGNPSVKIEDDAFSFIFIIPHIPCKTYLVDDYPTKHTKQRFIRFKTQTLQQTLNHPRFQEE